MSQFVPGSAPPPAPIPVQPLSYTPLVTQGRPGLITAIGVLSIVIASLSGLASLGIGVQSLGLLAVSRATTRLATIRATSRTSIASSSSSPGSPKSQALPMGDVGVAVTSLRQILSLDAAHTRELDRMLRLHGREVFGGDEDTPLTSSAIREQVTGSTSSPGGSNPAAFTTAQGTVSVFSDHAIFVSSDGATTITTSAVRGSDSQTTSQFFGSGSAPAAPSNVPAPLSRAQVNQIVAMAQRSSSQKLTAAQISALRAQLRSPAQQLIAPADVPSAVSWTIVQPDGTAHVTFSSGQVLVLGPQGKVISSGPPPIPKFTVQGSTVAIVAGEAAASIALAIYLLVVGILVLRSSLSTPRLLRIYAILKIPLALLAGIAIPWMFYQFISGFAASAPMPTPAPPPTAFIVWGVIIAALGIAFPVALLIALTSRTARDYFHSVRA